MTGASTAVASARPGRSLDARPPADRSTRAPIESPLQDYLAALHARLRGIIDGAVADYIPELLADLAERDLALLQRWLRSRRYRAGQTIVTAGQASDELFIITRGTVMVSTPTQDGVTRLDVLGIGMAFGEVAFLDRSPRSANVTATEDVECLVLARDDFGRLDVEAPAAKIRLLENIALGLARSLRNADRELAALR